MSVFPKFQNIRKEISTKFRCSSKKTTEISKVHSNSPGTLCLAKSSDNLLNFKSPIIKNRTLLNETMAKLESCTNSLQLCKYAFKLLMLCSEEEGIYSKEMKTVVKSLKNFLFINKTQLEGEILSLVYENHTETILSDDLVPVLYILDILKKEREVDKREITELNSQITTLKTSNTHLDNKTELENKDNKIKNLIKYIEMNISAPLSEKLSDILSLESQLKIANSKISELSQKIEENEEISVKIRQQNNVNTRLIYNFKCEEEKFKFKIDEMNKTITLLNKEISTLKEDNTKKQFFLEKTLVKVKSALEREKFFESRNTDLEQENKKLNELCGYGLHDLTPRPSFSGIELLLLEVPERSQLKARKLVQVLLEKSYNSKKNASFKKPKH